MASSSIPSRLYNQTYEGRRLSVTVILRAVIPAHKYRVNVDDFTEWIPLAGRVKEDGAENHNGVLAEESVQ